MADGSDPSSSRYRAGGDQTAAQRVHDLQPASAVIMTHEIRTTLNREVNRRMVNHYEFDHRVGVGQHGEVYLARDTKKDYMPVALKVVKRKNPKADKMSKFRKQNQNLPTSPHLPLTDRLGTTEHKIRKEIAIMKKCNHPHIVKLLEVIDDNLHEKIYMVMEYLGGGEIKWRTNDGEPVLRVDQTRRICRDVILGLEYLHHQGIIHRDIKPSNLLWTADRRTVKIADFGVAHFSYAQRLAAAGQGMVDPADEDPILMDDTDLSKTAGTPMFLAPEIVSDTSDPAASSSTVNVNETQSGRATARLRRRQPITKAIDVWAFGVTLYGLLFGHLPFQADREYEIYQIIRRQDWTVDSTMGVDRIETGGRHQRLLPKGQETDGYLAVKLLEGLLEKDARKRITLDQVKRHPWILRDMQNPDGWLRETQFEPALSLEPTADETSSAMSSVRFRWTKPLRRFWQGVRPTRSFLNRHVATEVDDYKKYKHVGVRSAPTYSLSRRRSTTGASQHDRRRDKSKSRYTGRDASRNKSTTDVGSRHANEYMSVQDWVGWDAARLAAPVPKRRRGSFTSNLRSSRAASPQPSPISASAPSVEPSSPEDRPPSRLSLTHWLKLPFRRQPATPIEQTPSSGSSNQSMTRRRSGQRLARRSEDAFNTAAPSRQSTASGQLTIAMRAASLGEMADYARPSEDVMSLYSAERVDDALDDDTFLLGAGGIAQSPVLSIPTSGVLSTVSSIASLNGPHTTAPSTPATMSVAHAILQRTDVGDLPSGPDPAAHDPSSLARQSQIRSRATSPLAQVSYNPAQISIASASVNADDYDDSSLDDDDDEDDASSYGVEVDRQPSTSQRYQEEDEESEDEGEVRLELRGRRPSQSASEMSPVRRGPDTPHRERPMICT